MLGGKFNTVNKMGGQVAAIHKIRRILLDSGEKATSERIADVLFLSNHKEDSYEKTLAVVRHQNEPRKGNVKPVAVLGPPKKLTPPPPPDNLVRVAGWAKEVGGLAELMRLCQTLQTVKNEL